MSRIQFLEIYSFLKHQLYVFLLYVGFIQIFFERCFLYHFLPPGRQAVLDYEWADSAWRREYLRTWVLSWVPFSGYRPLSQPQMCLRNRFCLAFCPMLVTSDPVRLAQLRDTHTCFIKERDDTPIASFIRLVLAAEDIRKKGDWVTVGNEIQYFWRRGVRGVLRPCHWIYGGEWLVKDIPDPRPWFGNNAMRYAFAACIAEQMAEVFNWRLDRLNVRRDRWTGKLSGQWDPRLPPPQPEHPPSWCAKVGPSPKRRIVDEYRRAHHTRCPEDEYSDIFAKRNLVAKTGFLEFA